MHAPDSIARSAEHLRQAVARMARHPAAFHPLTYAVWYEHVSGANAALSQAIEAHDGPFDDATIHARAEVHPGAAIGARTRVWQFAVVLGGNRVRPVTVAMFNFISVEQTQWARLAAGAMLAMAPVIIIGLVAQRHIVKGLTVGAVKGGGRR